MVRMLRVSGLSVNGRVEFTPGAMRGEAFAAPEWGGSFDPVFAELFAERAPVDAQDLGRRGPVARALLEQ